MPTRNRSLPAQLAERVKFCTGIDMEAFLLLKDLDEIPGQEPNNAKQSNPSKFLLYQDVLLGMFDKQIEGLDLSNHYAELEQNLRAKRDSTTELDYLFEMPEKLSAVLKRKSEIGILLKQAYDAKDADTFKAYGQNVLPAISKAVQERALPTARSGTGCSSPSAGRSSTSAMAASSPAWTPHRSAFWNTWRDGRHGSRNLSRNGWCSAQPTATIIRASAGATLLPHGFAKRVLPCAESF